MAVIPDFDKRSLLPPGIYNATLDDCLARFAVGSDARQQQGELLRLAVEAASQYETIKRVLVWGSFVSDKPAPGDLDYSLVFSVLHDEANVREEHRRFLSVYGARLYYGVDRGYLLLTDYPVERYAT